MGEWKRREENGPTWKVPLTGRRQGLQWHSQSSVPENLLSWWHSGKFPSKTRGLVSAERTEPQSNPRQEETPG